MKFLKRQKKFPGRLIVHIGDHKAGSSTIQRALGRGDVTLKDGTICYPLAGDMWHHNGLQPSLRAEMRTGGPPNGHVDRFLQLSGIARKENADVTILSAEALEYIDKSRLLEKIEKTFGATPDQIQFVTYLRPHFERFQSTLAERIKIGWLPWDIRSHYVDNFDEFPGKLILYADRLAAARNALGDSYIVRPMVRRELHDGDLLTDFFACTLGPDRINFTDTTRANESLSIQDLMRLHVMHHALPELSKHQHLALGWALSSLFPVSGPANETPARLQLPKEMAERTHKTCLEDARRVDVEWFDGRKIMEDALDRAVEKAPTETQSLFPEDWLSSEEIRTIRAFAKSLGELADGTGRWITQIDRITTRAQLS